MIATSTADDAARFEQSFRTLYTSEVPIVLRYLRASVANAVEAEALCAEAFLRAWVAWPRFRGQPGEARPWLLRIARNLVIDRHRRRRLLRIFPLRQQDSTGRDPTASEAIDRVQFQKALAAYRCILHVEPEAAAGGPIGLIEDGDFVSVDVSSRRLDLEVTPMELQRKAPGVSTSICAWVAQAISRTRDAGT
ncbi:MAG TPA: sigma factor [Candidatus Sulfotelmatobacter sp.]|nr:sigma factor [Candidatus Sulfotelmatobacter sp.]